MKKEIKKHLLIARSISLTLWQPFTLHFIGYEQSTESPLVLQEFETFCELDRGPTEESWASQNLLKSQEY